MGTLISPNIQTSSTKAATKCPIGIEIPGNFGMAPTFKYNEIKKNGKLPEVGDGHRLSQCRGAMSLHIVPKEP